MKKRYLRIVVAAMCAAMVLSACGAQAPAPAPEKEEAVEETAEAAEETEEGSENPYAETPLVAAYSNFNEKFSPFFAETAYDMDVVRLNRLPLLNSDRTGAVIYKGIEGETVNYNGTDYTYYGPADLEVTENADGTVYYDFTLREDLVFSDGTPITIDDVIFSMYVVCDPTFDGSATLFSQPIEGMQEYRAGMETLYNLLIAAGEDNTDFTNWDEATQKAFWEKFNKAKDTFVQDIVDYLIAAGAAEEGAPMNEIMANWGFGDVAADATNADVFDAMLAAYDGGVAAMTDTEKAGDSFASMVDPDSEYSVGVKTGDSAESITGIQKTGDYSMRVVATKVDATLIYQLTLGDGGIAPLHYYGDRAQYDYDNNKFGFPKGDLSMIRSKTTKPLGAGAYIFQKYENGIVSFEANPNYYLGEPETKYLQFREMADADKLNAVITGTADLANPTFSGDNVKAIQDENGGDVTGDKITTVTVDNLGYGYIGINSHNVNVGGDPASDASKNLRRAFATIFSVYRDVAIDSYYGERASVINYPISNTSWAAPQPADDGYRTAFSVDVEGNDIYTSGMSAEDKYAAAKEAALGFFEAAGYTVADGKITAAPAGAKMEYEALIPADGSGDHPSFMILTLAHDALEEIGMNLIVTDLSNSSDLWTTLEAGQGQIWCAAWGATVDPDMYQIYYSDVAGGGAEAGGSNYMYKIEDAELDKLILDARASTDQTYRKAMYKACLDIVIDWSCEVPVYQRQNAFIFSTERMDIPTLTPDQTTFYEWWHEANNIRMAY